MWIFLNCGKSYYCLNKRWWSVYVITHLKCDLILSMCGDGKILFLERYHNTPILTNGLGNMTIVVGENVSLSCQFVSDLHPFIVWTKLPYNNSNCSYEDIKDCNAIRLQVY